MGWIAGLGGSDGANGHFVFIWNGQCADVFKLGILETCASTVELRNMWNYAVDYAGIVIHWAMQIGGARFFQKYKKPCLQL